MDLKKVAPIARVALEEDVGRGDVTTRFCIPRDRRGRAAIIFKEAGIICGMDIAKHAFRLVDGSIKFKTSSKDGDRVRAGKVVARVEGPARGILTAERTALNFLSHLSGIATRTAEYVRRVRPYKAKIMDTRKTTPGLRYLEKYAVRVGGGVNHRMGLYDQVLIKDNHIQVASDRWHLSSEKRVLAIQELLKQAKRSSPAGMEVEVEVNNLAEFKEALKMRPDIIMLDNMPIKTIKEAVKIRNNFIVEERVASSERPLIEVSGRVTLGNVRDIARCGVDMISIGELTHSVRSIDVALEIE